MAGDLLSALELDYGTTVEHRGLYRTVFHDVKPEVIVNATRDQQTHPAGSTSCCWGAASVYRRRGRYVACLYIWISPGNRVTRPAKESYGQVPNLLACFRVRLAGRTGIGYDNKAGETRPTLPLLGAMPTAENIMLGQRQFGAGAYDASISAISEPRLPSSPVGNPEKPD